MHHFFPCQQWRWGWGWEKKNYQKNALIGRGDWSEIPVFFFTSLTSKWVLEARGCHSAVEVEGRGRRRRGRRWGRGRKEEAGEGQSLAPGWNWNDALFPLTAARPTVIKCLIVASWEFVLNISSGVMIIWVWVGRGCNHLGWLFDEILGAPAVFYGRFKCPFWVFT